MFSKNVPNTEDKYMSKRESPFTIIASDVVITGNVTAQADLHIDGCIEGDVTCASLIQGRESQIKGKINTNSARLSGFVLGSIESEELIVEGTAKIQGDVTYQRISVETGASLEAKFLHTPPAQGAELKLVKTDYAAEYDDLTDENLLG